MSESVGIVDLFSGPGGLGEGFSAFEDSNGNRPYSIRVSIENEPSAHATLRLRSFLRKFEDGHPAEYYDLLNERIAEPDWRKLCPKEWAAAEDEVHFLYQEYVNVLGELAPAVFVMENVKGMLSSAVKGGGIFQKVMSDLKSAAGANSYRLVALAHSEWHSD